MASFPYSPAGFIASKIFFDISKEVFQLFQSKFEYITHDPGQEVRAGSLRKTPEIDGTWKQYSGKQIRRPDLSGSARNRQEPGKTGSRIRSPDSCVGFLTFSGGFRRETVRFLRVSAGKFTE
jgi:hypothetical protein